MKSFFSQLGSLISKRPYRFFFGVSALALFAFLFFFMLWDSNPAVPTDREVNEIIDELQESTGLDLSDFLRGSLLAQLTPTSGQRTLDSNSLEFRIRPVDSFQAHNVSSDGDNTPSGIFLSNEASSVLHEKNDVRFEMGVQNFETVAESVSFSFSRITDFEGFADDLSQRLLKTDTNEGFGKLMDSVLSLLSQTFLKDALSLRQSASQLLYHPNGEVLSWAMFYKFLAQKANVPVSLHPGEEWFIPYERWFRIRYSQYPYFDAAEPADEQVVRVLFGGLPTGVTFQPPVATVGSATYGDVSPLLDFSESQEAMLYHPNGEILSWAMFYKFLAQKLNIPLASKAGEDWFVPYENWFQDTYPNLSFYDPSAPAQPSIVSGLYGGLPPGVTFRQPITGIADLIQDPFFRELLSSDTSFSPVAFQVHANEAQQYVDAYYGAADDLQNLYTADGVPVTWADFWPLVVQRESDVLAESGGRPIPLSNGGETPYAPWFQRYFPELRLPRLNEVVTLSQAEFFLKGQLPEGSYGINPKLQQVLKSFSASTSTETPFGFKSVVQSVSQEDSIPVYEVRSPEETVGDEDAFGLDFLANAIRSLLEEKEFLRIDEELDSNLEYQADIDGFISGSGQPINTFSFSQDQASGDGPNLSELAQVFASVQSAPSFLESIRVLSQLFAFEGEIADETFSPVSEEISLSQEDEASLLQNCSQTEEGEVLDDHPNCQLLTP